MTALWLELDMAGRNSGNFYHEEEDLAKLERNDITVQQM